MSKQLARILTQPVPDFTAARQSKQGYRRHMLLPDGWTRNDEPLVDIELYGIAGQSYYSRPNNATGAPVEGVSPAIMVRQSIAEKLAQINYELQESREVEQMLGGKVELFVNEGYRSLELQTRLYEQDFPRLIKEQHPTWSKAEIDSRRDQLVARPTDGKTPAPHATGAAVDVKLRYQSPELGFVPHVDVEMGQKGADANERTYPDYFEHIEHKEARTKTDEAAQRNRRIFYWIMRGALLGDDSGFVVNPTEWWHWSYGDQLWAQLTNSPHAFFREVGRA